MLSLLSYSSAFAPGGVPSVGVAARSAPISMVEYSAAIPFLKKPPALDGSMPGDVGFDPLGFSTTITELGGDLNYVREAELMHGRQAMLACVGMVAPAIFGKLPVPWTADVSTNPLIAQSQLPDAVFYQLVVTMLIAEGLRSRIIYAEDSVPGEHGFDPLGFITGFKLDDPEKMKVMKTKEVLNGRLAMIAWVGMYAQLQVTGHIWPLI